MLAYRGIFNTVCPITCVHEELRYTSGCAEGEFSIGRSAAEASCGAECLFALELLSAKNVRSQHSCGHVAYSLLRADAGHLQTGLVGGMIEVDSFRSAIDVLSSLL